MADKNLGPLASIVTLPATFSISMPISYPKQIESRVMSDGSIRRGFFKRQRRWTLNWRQLTKTQLDALITIYDYDQILRWQNNDESADWYNVVITNFAYDVIDPISSTKIYIATMILEQDI